MKNEKRGHLQRRNAATGCIFGAGLAISLMAFGPDDTRRPTSPGESEIDGFPVMLVPAENPITEEKRILGKILFWDEQLSSDNTMACATCHLPGDAGTDLRRQPNPGIDSIFMTPDDTFASPGVINCDANDDYERHPNYNLNRQVTGRTAPSMINAAFNFESFWDGRASSIFTDPVTGAQVIADGGSLESQAVGPPQSTAEMSHADRDWNMIAAKLRNASPLALATNLQPDVATAIGTYTNYADLFEMAFGDKQITATRIAFAIATYERTLISDQSPWDEFIGGNPNGMTPNQIQGWNIFQNSNCTLCHPAPLFTDNDFHNIGLRPPGDDSGRQQVTGNPGDNRKFKTPGLRNMGLRGSFMHTGEFTNMMQVVTFYANPANQFPQNQDPLMAAVTIPPPPAGGLLEEFLLTGLLDPRVANAEFPFDELDLYSFAPMSHTNLLMAPRAGSGGLVPQLITNVPPNIGNEQFKVGVRNALGGATARVLFSTIAPTGNILNAQTIYGPFTLEESGAGNGYSTFHWPIPFEATLNGTKIYMQWEIDDPGAVGGNAYSRIAEFTLFCGPAGCPEAPCFADCDGNGTLNIFDYICFGNAYASGLMWADCDGNGALNIFDYICFGNEYAAGCP
ncbi:MAG: hypothetical protein H6815_02780 [Phycisphaeraceae bacterium]|nr:hypothetical protein [Phycisphaerales bacterium]MCB9859352.1 hypothetical protein [Phycisphaeraceae bacterium]